MTLGRALLIPGAFLLGWVAACLGIVAYTTRVLRDHLESWEGTTS